MRLPSRLAVVLLAAIGLSVLWPARADAQRGRVVRRPAVRTAVIVRGGYYPFYGYYPWYPYYPWGFYPYGFYPYEFYPYGYDSSASVRLQVTPREAEVFVDGHFAGVVDNYDGTFQRLHLEPGPHDIVLYHQAYRAVRQSLYLAPRASYKVRYTMVPLGPGEAPEPRPGPPPGAPRAPSKRRLPRRRRTRALDRLAPGSARSRFASSRRTPK